MAKKLFGKPLLCAALTAALLLGLAPYSRPALAHVDTFASVSAGGAHSLAVKTDGSLWFWGSAYTRILLSGDLHWRSSANAVPVLFMDDVATAAAGGYHSMAVKADGSLWVWGINDAGQVGDGTTEDRAEPVHIMDGVASVSAGYSHSLAIKNDGSLWAWGRNYSGELGDGTTIDRHSPVKIMEDVSAVSAGHSHSLAIKKDGSLWAWGINEQGQIGDGTVTEYGYVHTYDDDGSYHDMYIEHNHNKTTPVKILDNIVQADGGAYYSVAVKTDGSLWAWGGLNYNYLGGETVLLDRQLTPAQIMDGVASASAGSNFTVVRKTDGSLWAWGYGARGQIGAGYDVGSIYTPTKVLDGAASVSAGSSHTLAIKTDGSLWAWGDNRGGAVGPMAPEHCHLPVEVKAYDIAVILDGRRLEFDVPPYAINGRTLVPLQAVFSALGAAVVWDNATKTVTATKGDTVLRLTIGDPSPTVNGQVVPIDQPMIAMCGRTLVPLKFVAEAFGVTVDWDALTWTVTITS